MKTFNKIFILMASVALLNVSVSAQNNKTAPPTEVRYSTSTSINDVHSMTTIPPEKLEFSSKKKDLLRQLDEARTSNNIQLKEQIEASLNQLDGKTTVQMTENFTGNGGAVTANNKPPFNNEPDYMSSQITGGGFFSTATQTESAAMPHPGRIWTAVTLFNSAGPDTCNVYFSNDGGQTWTYSYYFYMGGNMDFRAGELDIELVYDGAALWIYGVAGYNDITLNRVSSFLFRFNTTANTYGGYILTWPGSGTATNKYYNPRITSDNSNYTNSSYIYLSSSFDSTSGGTHTAKQKYAHITNPFVASPTIDYNQTNANTGGFYWTSSSSTEGYLWSDIAYYKTSNSFNRVITVYSAPITTLNNFYMAWSDDYGTTATGNSIVTQTNVNYGARMVFNGGSSNYNGMIAYVRQYNGNDWDSYFTSTTDGGSTWASGYIDQSANRTRSVDIIAPRGANNLFKAAYTQDSTAGVFGYYTGGNGTAWNSPLSHPVTPNHADTTFGKVIAGYKMGGGDDCFALYSLDFGVNVYGSRLCQTTTGIINNNNETPSNYTLSQNYPNPFNPTTNIKFSIPKTGMIKLTVFDITGKVVATLVDAQLNSGNYTFDFDASNIATGVYFYKLQADGFSEVKKMLLVK